VSVKTFHQIADLLPEPMLLVAENGKVLTANPGLQDRLDISPRHIKGRRLAELLADPPETVAQFLRICTRGRRMIPADLTLHRENGENVPCRFEGAVFRPADEESPALLLIRLLPKESAASQFFALDERVTQLTKEIARRKDVEAALHEKSESLQVTLASIADAVIVTDSRGAVTFLNPVAESLTGWSQIDAAGQSLERVFAIVNEKSRQPVESKAAEVLRSKKFAGLANDTILIARDGTEKPIEDSGAPIWGVNGEVLGVVLVFRDISERRKMQLELREADRRKNEFLATLAHELRNPLAPVRNGLQILRLAAGDAETLERTRQMMERQLGHMVRLIDDLLDVSRITRGKIELRKERVDLASVVHTALEASHSAIEAAGHELTVCVPAEPIPVHADPTRLAQVVSNILNNAARYTPPGGHIWLKVERQERQAIVRMRDNGSGIPREMLPRLFEMFTQGNRGLESSQSGPGIGLALVQNLVHLHGGTIEAQSAGVGQGSEFIVRLPLADLDIPR
jgi:PAS domain S-box-containing protein